MGPGHVDLELGDDGRLVPQERAGGHGQRGVGALDQLELAGPQAVAGPGLDDGAVGRAAEPARAEPDLAAAAEAAARAAGVERMTAVREQLGERQAEVAGVQADLRAAVGRFKVQVGFDGRGSPVRPG